MGKYNEKEILILQHNTNFNDWEDVTTQVQWYNDDESSCRIKYYSSDTFYRKSWNSLAILKNPKKIEFNNCITYFRGKCLSDIIDILKFDSWFKIFYKSGSSSTYRENQVSFIKDKSSDEKSIKLITYLKEVTKLISTIDGNTFLYDQLSKIKVFENSFLSKFIFGKMSIKNDAGTLVFPFSVNASQKKAVKNAMTHDLSIIQGPPGTGKTQTILNIVANCITQGENVAVLSGGNEATKNVEEKLSKFGYGFINAVLGCSKNRKEFFENENSINISGEKNKLTDLERKIAELENNINTALQYKFDISKINNSIDEYGIEKEINDAEYKIKNHHVPQNIQKLNYTSKKLLELSSYLEVLPEAKITNFFNRARLLFRFGVIRAKKLSDNKNDIIEYLKNKFYAVKIEELNKEKSLKEEYLNKNNMDKLSDDYSKISKQIFDQALINRFANQTNENFDNNNYKLKFEKFLRRYPVIYSTTHAIRSCSADNYLYDCVIIDESSQVDLASAIIAFSCAKRVVLVGDDMQITHVVKSNLIPKLENLFNNSGLPSFYDYQRNNILKCTIAKFPNAASVLLNEHYRCDPQIISFCNKRFYNNQLVIKTEHQPGSGLTIVKHGSHFERGRANERQTDIIDKEIAPQVDAKETGIIAPYNAQIDLLKEKLKNTGFIIDTIHQFQGREKDNIILSTVANKVRFYEDDERIDFLNQPNLINVAISRAKNKLYILASEEVLRQEGSLLRDLSRYCEYYCNETKIIKTNVYSVFDLMYDDYAPILEDTRKKLLKISKWTSENIIATVIKEICDEKKHGAISYKFNYPLKYVVKTDSFTNEEDLKFISNINTHCDFVIYNLLDKSIELIVEVDGSQHKEKIQADRDNRKDRLIKSAGLKITRLPTTTIECKQKIENALVTNSKGEVNK